MTPTEEVSVTRSNFIVGDRVRIPTWTEQVFEIVKIQSTNPVTYKIKDWNGETTEGSLYEPELEKTSQGVFHMEKVIRKNCRRAFVK